MEEKPVIRLICLGLLGGGDEVNRGSDRGDRSGDEVVIGVADDGKPVTCAQAIKRGGHFGMRLDPSQDRQQYLLIAQGGRIPGVGKRLSRLECRTDL